MAAPIPQIVAILRARAYFDAGSGYIAYRELVQHGDLSSADAVSLIEHWKNNPPAGQAERPKDTPC